MDGAACVSAQRRRRHGGARHRNRRAENDRLGCIGQNQSGDRCRAARAICRMESSTVRSMSRHYKWAVVGMLWFVCFFNYADRQAIFSIFPKLKAEFGFDPVQLGLIGSAFMWIYAAGAPLAGFIADHFPRKHLILGGCLFWSAITVLTGFCQR